MEETALPPIALGLDDWNEVKRINQTVSAKEYRLGLWITGNWNV